jgi:hypothetical protein
MLILSWHRERRLGAAAVRVTVDGVYRTVGKQRLDKREKRVNDQTEREGFP